MPYLVEHDNSDCVSEPDAELFLAAPAQARRIRIKSNVELDERQQLALERLNDDLHIEPSLATPHDILHFHSHKDCAICREVKQRRYYLKPVL